MSKKIKSLALLDYAKEMFPNAKTELENWQTPFQFLVCIILSAQATDKGVNKVTQKLFEKYRTVNDFAKADINEIDGLVKSINYHNTKSKHIKNCAIKLIEEFDGVVPWQIDDLVSLAGVGYKTANVFVNAIYPQKSQGIAVDTHVDRVVKRIGLVDNVKLSPTKTAKELEALYDKKYWKDVNTLFVLYGRYHCTARNPACKDCRIKQFCEYYKG